MNQYVMRIIDRSESANIAADCGEASVLREVWEACCKGVRIARHNSGAQFEIMLLIEHMDGGENPVSEEAAAAGDQQARLPQGEPRCFHLIGGSFKLGKNDPRRRHDFK